MRPSLDVTFALLKNLRVLWTVHGTQVWTQMPAAFAIQTHT